MMNPQDRIGIIGCVVLILVLLAPFSCKSQEDIEQLDAETIQQEQNSNYNESIYFFENDEFIQRVIVHEINDESISFVLISENKIKKLSSTISGVAKLKEGGVEGVEVDVDDRGLGYFADEYIYYTYPCWLAFRIKIETKSLMRIKENGCYALHNRDCPFASIGILKLQ